MSNALLKRLESKPVLLGMQCFTGTPAIVEILGYAGFDLVSLDMEHSPSGFEAIEQAARAANVSGIVPLVRVETNDPIQIMKALDRGVSGVIVPHVGSREDLERAVRACKYPPDGERGACSSVRATHYSLEPWVPYYRRANDEVIVVPLVEDRAGLEAFDELLAVKGVDVYWIGTRDLAQSLGLPGVDLNNERLRGLARELNAKAKDAGKVLMATVSPHLNLEYGETLMEMGFRILSYGSEQHFFAMKCAEVVAHFRGLQKAAS